MQMNKPENTQALAVGPHITYLPIPAKTDALLLIANTNVAYVVPSNMKFMQLSCEDDFYMRKGAAASVPAANILDGTASQQNPAHILVDGDETLNFIAPRESVLTIVLLERA